MIVGVGGVGHPLTIGKLSDIVDDALSILDGINANGDLEYDVYVEIHNLISNIYNRFVNE